MDYPKAARGSVRCAEGRRSEDAEAGDPGQPKKPSLVLGADSPLDRFDFHSGSAADEVLRVLEDYDKHSVYFAPDVERSKIESRSGDHFRVFLRFRRRKVVTVVLNTEHTVDYFHDAPGKAHSRSSAVRIREVGKRGKGDEREKNAGCRRRISVADGNLVRIAEGDGGVYVQSEVASLTRDIPTDSRG